MASQLTNSGPVINLPQWLTVPNLELNLGTIAALTWGGLYVLLEPVAGTALAGICLGATAFCNSIRIANPTVSNQVAIAVHVVCWILQFVGHGAFEGRAPALLDNLVQAVFLAPLFVWLELLFKIGYRPELQARVEKAVLKEIAKFKAKNEKTQ
jgi:2-hydroxy fatty acid dioxygenase